MIFLIIVLGVSSSLYQFQKKYDYCVEQKFEKEYCELQKSLHKYKKD